MANATSVQIIQDGPRNCVVKFQGSLDSGDLASTTVVDPALLSEMTTGVVAGKLRINEVTYIVEDGLAINLLWDATTDLEIASFEGRGEAEYEDFGGLTNNAGAGVTGKILATSEGAAVGATKTFCLVLELVKTA